MKKLILFLSLIALISCAKENTEYEDPCNESNLIRKVRINNLDIQEVTYDGNCQLNESIERFAYQKYIYNSSNQLEKIEVKFSYDGVSCYMQPGSTGETFTDPRKAKVGMFFVFEYNVNGTLAKKKLFYNNNDAPQLTSYEVYTYKENQIEKIETFNPNGERNNMNTFEYDSNGNVKKSDFYSISNSTPFLSSSYTYQFDDKINPFLIFAAEGSPGKYTNPNNIITEVLTNYGMNGYQSEDEISYTYEYNSLGYPVMINQNSYIYGN